FFQAEDGIRDKLVTGVQTCALPIWRPAAPDFSDHDRDPPHVPGRADRGAPASARHTGRAATLRTDTLEPLRVVREPAWSLDGRRSEERRVGKECRSRVAWGQ